MGDARRRKRMRAARRGADRLGYDPEQLAARAESERVRRGLTPAERAVVRKLLTGDFPGAGQFRRQVDAITVVRECGCGRCGTIDFEVDRQRAEAAPLPLWADVDMVAESATPSWLMLFQRDGWLTELEHVADHGPEPKQIDPTEIEVEEWPERHPR